MKNVDIFFDLNNKKYSNFVGDKPVAELMESFDEAVRHAALYLKILKYA